MQQDEFNFMLDKLSTSVSSVLSLKKSMLFEIAKNAEKQLTETQRYLDRAVMGAYPFITYER